MSERDPGHGRDPQPHTGTLGATGQAPCRSLNDPVMPIRELIWRWAAEYNSPSSTAKEQRVVIIRPFTKKAEKTPAGEIGPALQRADEMKL